MKTSDSHSRITVVSNLSNDHSSLKTIQTLYIFTFSHTVVPLNNIYQGNLNL